VGTSAMAVSRGWCPPPTSRWQMKILFLNSFLEKIFLLHKEFSQNTTKIRIDRLSRHIYDVEKLMDTEQGKAAINYTELYKGIVIHRKKLIHPKGLTTQIIFQAE
jgi:hypothetical protein